MFPVCIDGERIYLRDFVPDDLDATLRIVGDPEVTWYLSFDAKTRDEQREALQRDIERAQQEPRPDYYLAVIRADSEELIGFARLGLGAHRGAKLGYAIRKDHWNKGYATEAARTMLDFGFGPLGLHRITAACGPQNLSSQRVLTKLGFAYEGRLRDHVFTNDAWRDSLLYSVLDHEWQAAPETPMTT